MEEKDNGGYAFACVTERHLQEGMTLRDYFAAQALSGYLSAAITQHKNHDGEVHSFIPTHSVVSEEVYKYADAMLEARKK